MRDQVTVIPGSGVIIVDGMPLACAFKAEGGLHALQWQGGAGVMEYDAGRRGEEIAGAKDYRAKVAPYVALWEDERARQYLSPPLATAVANARAAITARRKRAEYGGFLFAEQRWDSEEKDELRLNSVITMMEKTGLSEFPGWKISEDSFITLTPETALAAAVAMMRHYNACFAVEETKKNALADADPQTAADVQNWLDRHLDDGWPESAE